MTNKEQIAAIKDQEWALVADSGGRIVRYGNDFADRLAQMEVYDNPREVLASSKVGDVINTGVSAYERIK